MAIEGETITYTVKEKRTVTDEKPQHVCDVCQEPATCACRDAIETIPNHWEQGELRFGCNVHPVKAEIKSLDGTIDIA
jgi:hypothetical protein